MIRTILTPRGQIAELAAYRALARSIVRDPINLLLLSIAWFSVLFGFTGVPFRGQSFAINQLVLGLALVLHVTAQYFWLGRWLQLGARWNVPLLVSYSAFYTVAHCLFHLVFGPLVFDADFAISWARFWRTYPIALIVTVAYVFSFLPRARSYLAPRVDPQPADAPGAALPGITGKLRLIRIDGKMATIVTDRGERVIRSGLGELVEGLDPDLGLRCHRSLWVAKDQIAGLIYLKGNPHITLHDDSLFPISRSVVPQVKACLKTADSAI